MKTFRAKTLHSMKASAVYFDAEDGHMHHEAIVEECWLWVKARSAGAARRTLLRHIDRRDLDMEILEVVRVVPQYWMRTKEAVYATMQETVGE